MADYKKALPRPTPETLPFWEGCKEGELRLQRCTPHGHVYFPPRPFCPRCASRDVAWFRASGRGKLHTYVINYRPAPGFEDEAPYAIAVVELDEGPRMMSNIVGVEQSPEALIADMPLEVVFERATDEITLPKFRPAAER